MGIGHALIRQKSVLRFPPACMGIGHALIRQKSVLVSCSCMPLTYSKLTYIVWSDRSQCLYHDHVCHWLTASSHVLYYQTEVSACIMFMHAIDLQQAHMYSIYPDPVPSLACQHPSNLSYKNLVRNWTRKCLFIFWLYHLYLSAFWHVLVTFCTKTLSSLCCLTAHSQSRLQCRLRAALTVCLYDKALTVKQGSTSSATSTHSTQLQQQQKQAQQQHAQTPPDLSTLVGVDASAATNILISVQELWSLPCQLALALYLLYAQVRGLMVTCKLSWMYARADVHPLPFFF